MGAQVARRAGERTYGPSRGGQGGIVGHGPILPGRQGIPSLGAVRCRQRSAQRAKGAPVIKILGAQRHAQGHQRRLHLDHRQEIAAQVEKKLSSGST